MTPQREVTPQQGGRVPPIPRPGGAGRSIPLPVLTPAMTSPQAALVADHPCYSQDAHQYYARMHAPVAPGCNIQCNYCNRKFDCSNESRPGVTSALLTPEQALAKVKRVANGVKQLRVLGIAGPGEPLANAQRTFRTMELVARDCPDLRLCLSTNGLTLLDHVDRIAALGIDHVTITINMTDPEIGAKIYPWIAFRGRRYTGTAAARILSERQLAGLAALTGRGILCKVNSVVIPGVNDGHLVEVSRTVRDLGAFTHNVMPLVSATEHGTHFGLTGQREPSAGELARLRERCEDETGTTMGMMRHCRQCRADAVGLLGEDRSEEFSEPDRPSEEFSEPDRPSGGYDLDGRARTHAEIERWRAEVAATRLQRGIVTGGTRRPEAVVLVAIATTGGGVVNEHYGRAAEFWIYEAGRHWAKFIGIRKVPRSCGGPAACGEPSAKLDATVELLSDCAAVLCSKIGPQPHAALTGAGRGPRLHRTGGRRGRRPAYRRGAASADSASPDHDRPDHDHACPSRGAAMTAITLSDRAAQRIHELLETIEGPTRFGLRVGVDSFGWTQRYRLSLAERPEENELVIRLSAADIDVFVSDNTAALIDGVRIDYVETPGSAGFTFHNPRPAGSGTLPASPGRRGGQLGSHREIQREGRRPGHVDAELWNRIEAAMDDVRPYLRRDGGDASVVDVTAGTLWIELEGACSGCSASQVTVVGVIEQQVHAAVPEITRVAVVS